MTAATADDLKAQGNKAFSSGDYQTAVDLFSKAIELDGSNHVLFSNRSAAFCAMKSYDAALTDAEKAIKSKPDWAKGYGRKGAALYGLHRLDEAEKAYSEGLKLEPENGTLRKGIEDVHNAASASKMPSMGGADPFASMFQGDVLAKLAANPKVSSYLADPEFVQKLQMIKQNPQMFAQHLNDPRMLQVMGALMGIDVMSAGQGADIPVSDTTTGFDAMEQDKPAASAAATPATAESGAEAQEEVEMETELSSEEEEAKQRKEQAKKEKELGNECYKRKNFDEAIKHYDSALELDETDVTVMNNKAAVFFEQGEYQRCIEICELAVEKGREFRTDFKNIARSLGRIGNAYWKLDDLPNAIKYYQKSLSEHRTADILTKLREVEKLKEKADREAYQNPQLADEARNRGNDLFKQGKFAEAVAEYTEAIKRAEFDPRAYSNRAACYTKLMALNEALRDCEKAIQLDADFVKAYIRKAAVQFQMREYAKCIQTCDDALKVDAEHHAGKNRSEIEAQKQKATFATYGIGGEDENLSQEERAKRAMNDPKVQEILSDPVMRQILEQMSTDPAAAQDHMKNPLIREKIQILAAAGVIGLR